MIKLHIDSDIYDAADISENVAPDIRLFSRHLQQSIQQSPCPISVGISAYEHMLEHRVELLNWLLQASKK